jgi:Tfp pilus assembly protein PilF
VSDAAVGHTAGYVYPLLEGMRSLLSEVRDEATADSIVGQLAKVRERAKTDVDHRALDLLGLLVERRAAELLNQPGPHAQKALTALQRAFKRKCSDGEPRLMAQFLEHLGRISQPKLAEEQLRQLRSLHAEAAKGTVDRLYIARHLANVLWNYSRHDEAVDLLQTALDEHQEAAGGVLPASVNDVLGTLISYLESRRHYARGEKYLFEQLKHPANPPQSLWLSLRLYDLYNSAVGNDGDVSLGRGATLYAAVRDKLLKDLAAPNHDHRRALVERLCSLWSTAHNKKTGDAVADLRAFAFQRFPELLKRHPAHHQSLVGTVAHTLHDIASVRDGIRLIVESIESEPGWLRYNNNDGWQRHGGTLAYWRTQLKEPLGDLEPRLLKIVCKELRLELESRQSRNRNMYWQHHSYYWKEKEADFLAVAEDVWAERKKSGAAVAYIAEYMYTGLGRYDRAIEILFIAYRDKLLDQSAQARLVQFLHWQNRYGESIAVLQAMIERWPDNLTYRTQLLHAYFRTQQPKALLGLLEQTDEHFHKNGRWTEHAMAALGYSCLENELFEQSVKYYNEAIPLHQRTQPRRGIGNGTLSQYYANQARAYAGLKKTAEAVDAACGAVISWGPRHDRRAEALIALRHVLQNAPDLDAYVVKLNEESEKTGQDKPIVRKALGQVYLDRKEYDKAMVQLRIACNLQPNDTEIHQALVACCDARGDKEEAMRQLLQSVQLSRRDIKLYEDLGRRLVEMKQPQEAERAYTSTVEMLPAESESHTLLAEIRQKQNRWPEAIVQWEQVARIRALEPTGPLKLAEAHIHQKQWEAAADTLRKLESKTWPSRFGDLGPQIRQLWQRIDRARKTSGG